MTTPVRIQLSRKKGFRLQEASMALNGLPAVKVDRTTKWGNPYTKEMARKYGFCECSICLAANYQTSLSDEGKALIRKELRGKNLACWCSPKSDCHAEVLLSIANSTADEERELRDAFLAGRG